MDYEELKRLLHHHPDLGMGEAPMGPPGISPGKRTLTMGMPPHAANWLAQTPTQQSENPATLVQRKEQTALTEHWMNAAVRPDLNGTPEQDHPVDAMLGSEPATLQCEPGWGQHAQQKTSHASHIGQPDSAQPGNITTGPDGRVYKKLERTGTQPTYLVQEGNEWRVLLGAERDQVEQSFGDNPGPDLQTSTKNDLYDHFNNRERKRIKEQYDEDVHPNYRKDTPEERLQYISKTSQNAKKNKEKYQEDEGGKKPLPR